MESSLQPEDPQEGTRVNKLQSTALFLLIGTCAAPGQLTLTQPTSPTLPQWQIAAGRKMAFEVASVKPYPGAYRSAHFPLDAGSAYMFSGGRFSAAFPVFVYILFAWK
jgi:hypothetical protein